MSVVFKCRKFYAVVIQCLSNNLYLPETYTMCDSDASAYILCGIYRVADATQVFSYMLIEIIIVAYSLQLTRD